MYFKNESAPPEEEETKEIPNKLPQDEVAEESKSKEPRSSGVPLLAPRPTSKFLFRIICSLLTLTLSFNSHSRALWFKSYARWRPAGQPVNGNGREKE